MSLLTQSLEQNHVIWLSIIIVSWNTRELLLQCLSSLSDYLPSLSAETIVVDNASTDGSAQAVEEQFPWVHLITNQENVGFSRANNQAINQSGGHYILLLNPDTEVYPGSLETLVNYLNEHPAVGAVGARILNPDGSLQDSCYPAPSLSRELWRLLHLDAIVPYGTYHMSSWHSETPRKVDTLLGACLLLRRDALVNIGLLDEEYFFTGEEIDLCHRLGRAGWHIHWVPQARVVHYGGQSSKQVAEKSFLFLYGGKILYFRKQHGTLTAALYKLILLVSTLLRLLLAPLAWLERSPRREQHLILVTRYLRLLANLPSM
jgi:N-acetylglucosaminyl-diphospho-decaprenol L-rhamnosyltransferase